ncbi:MAG: hypothetical protein ACR2IQ_02500 [Minisyncoccia bacterium]
MEEENTNTTNRIEDIKSKLFMSKLEEKMPVPDSGILHGENYNVKRNWKENNAMKKAKNILGHRTFFRTFFLASFVVLVVSAVFVYISITEKTKIVSNDRIDMTILGNSFAAGGEQFSMEVATTNRNRAQLDLADIIVTYPKDASEKGEQLRAKKEIGTILPGETKRTIIPLVLYGEGGSIKPISIMLEYHIAGSNALFTKQIQKEITLSGSSLSIGIEGSTTVVSNQPYTFVISIDPTAEDLLKNMAVSVDFPPGFTFQKSDPVAFSGNNLWSLGDLIKGTKKQITITGTINGITGDEKVFHIYIGEQDKNGTHGLGAIYAQSVQTVLVDKAFLDAHIVYNNINSDIYAVGSGSDIPVSINYTNNTNNVVHDVIITATITGSSFDKKSVKSNFGVYDESKGVIIWNSEKNQTLSDVDPGAGGSVNFNFSAISGGVGAGGDIVVTVSITGTPIDSISSASTLSALDRKVFRLGAQVDLDAVGYYTSGPLKNTGSNPPIVGSATTYTVGWVLSNTTNSVDNGVVKGILPRGIEWVGETYPTDETVVYNSASREVTWRVGTLKKNQNDNIRRQTFFKVSLNPTVADVGSVPILLTQSTFNGTDSYTTSNVRVTKDPVTLKRIEGSGDGKITRQ